MRASTAEKPAARSTAPFKPEELIQTSFRLSRTRWTHLQQLSIEERVTVQSIIVGALEAEFARRGKEF